ncbi:MAG: hypothetical protein WCI36_00835 [bacterium]
MKILIVDDSKKHREAARKQLETLGHEVVITGGYTDVFRGHILKDNSFDVALIDLLMPAESMTLGERGMEFFGQEIMVGYPLSIFLAMSGVKLVGVVTDTGHHDHPASAIMDFLCEPLIANGANVFYLHARLTNDGSKDWSAALKSITR